MSVTVPGAVAGWVALAKRFGRLSLAELAAPAIRFAREGYAVTPIIAAEGRLGADRLGAAPSFAACFMPDGRAPEAGGIFRSEAHARTLESIAASGGQSFYEGDLAREIVADARRAGGAVTLEDLAAHRVEWVPTPSQSYFGAVVHELPPNGQGIATVMALGMLEALGPVAGGPDEVDAIHLAIEATKLALVDLDEHLADLDAMAVTPAALLDPAYVARRAGLIDCRWASPTMRRCRCRW